MSEELTDEQADAMLKQLSAHFQQPVMPIRQYCAAFETWMEAIESAKDADGKPVFADLAPHMCSLQLAIRKSSLLYRLLYVGEKLRTRRCPEHDGSWSGLPFHGNDCEHGCDLTGWIPDDFVPPKPGEPCRHKWQWVSVRDGKRHSVCAECEAVVPEDA